MTNDETQPSSSDELDLFRIEAEALGMPATVTYESVGLRPTSAEDMLARVKAQSSDTPASDGDLTGRHPRRRTKFAISAAVVAAAAVGVVAIVVSPWQQSPAAAISPPVLSYEFANARNIAYAPGEPARAELLKLASAAESNGDTSTRSGTTQNVLTDNWFASLEATHAAQLIPKRRESWLRADGTVRVRERAGLPLSPDGRGISATAAANGQATVDETYPPSGDEPTFVQTLGTDKTQARTALLEAGQCEDRSPGPVRSACLFQQVSVVFSQYVVPPQASATLWRVLADEEDLRLLGHVKDRAGRAGVGIAITPVNSPQFRKIIIISPRTGELLGSEDVLIKNDDDVNIKAPAIYSFTAYLDAAYTRERGPIGK